MGKLDKNRGEKIYDLLVNIGGAREDERQDFIYHHCVYENGCQEWRFRGKLGFGGKYRSTWNGVTYYPETSTDEIDKIAEELNQKLKEL